MSDNNNTSLLDRASEMVEYFEGKLPAKLILMALDKNDLDLVRKYTLQAEALVAEQQIYGQGLVPNGVR